MNLDDFSDLIERADGGIRRDAEERRERLVVPPGALGRLDELGEWLSAAQATVKVRAIEQPKVVLFAGDHGVASRDVSGRAPGTTHELVRAVLDGASPLAVLARSMNVPVRVVDAGLDCEPELLPAEVVRHRVRRGSGRIDVENALTVEETEAAVRLGIAIADEEADSGTDLVVLGDLSVGGTTPASTLIAALCGTDASVVTGRGGAGIDDLAWMRKCAAVRDSLRRARPVLGDQLELLAAVGGADLAAMTGFLLQASVRRMPVILDGVVGAACALVAQRAAFRAPDWWLAGQVSGEPAQAKALDRMALNPLLDHGVHVGEGTGALLALPLVQAAAAFAAELPERPDPTAPDAQGTPDAEVTPDAESAPAAEGAPEA
ncbi:nicotinate-nucleotide--dimethylbenzimidazole phosphoribosyltransferase [Streptomyces sp. NBC_00094]|uniref:nicotinate-nucleotide--dimethylbenzimidazole phosphoribosyltransferase n=1 Tax=Streptomyces sp. NBC_00094 TaxID=2903620 RepID=UPI00225641DF|nr:nicotinate-nucleotide--dimethylbenzimidazole phosphoribosyltransferase [Streptomyces sp. NBC_00094]MCX5390251.1 nicotinate-nucleotide--dimethylbenzimidazole phosphoribosyltransferase [Streptomyces sp. NBC_00094]